MVKGFIKTLILLSITFNVLCIFKTFKVSPLSSIAQNEIASESEERGNDANEDFKFGNISNEQSLALSFPLKIFQFTGQFSKKNFSPEVPTSPPMTA